LGILIFSKGAPVPWNDGYTSLSKISVGEINDTKEFFKSIQQ